MCVFCRIGAGEIPVHKVAESPRLLAFLDNAPIRPGHVLIIPRAHFPYFEDLPADLSAEIFALGQDLARMMKRELGVAKVGFMFTGNHVKHVHAHVVPLHEQHDLTSQAYLEETGLTWRLPPSPGDAALAAIAARLHGAL